MFDIKINNYRGFINQELELKRVNILIGENSSGKSSLIKFLLAVKQTFENPESSNLILSGNLVDLGNYKEAVYMHKSELNIDCSFSYKDDEMLRFFKSFFDYLDVKKSKREVVKYLKDAFKAKTSAFFSINNNLDKHSSIVTNFTNNELGKLTIKVNKNKLIPKHDYIFDGIYFSGTIVYESKIRSQTYSFDDIKIEKRGFLSIVVASSLQEKCDLLGDDMIFYEMALLLISQNFIKYQISNCVYINPLCSIPERIFLKKDYKDHESIENIKDFVDIIDNKKIDKSNFELFNTILKKYGLIDRADVRSSSKFPVSELRVKIGNLSSNISDVGCGVSLQIPLLFNTFYAEKSLNPKIFLIEQPEVHLHPSLQSKFIDTILSFGERNNYIIETHSEYMIRMLQVLIKQKKITNEEVRIYYFSKGGEKFDIKELRISADGKMIDKIPDSFYGNSYSLTKELMF